MRNTKNDSPQTIRNRIINAAFAKLKFRGLSNLDFSRQDSVFIDSCTKVGIEPSIRQASKYRNKQGLAYNSK